MNFLVLDYDSKNPLGIGRGVRKPYHAAKNIAAFLMRTTLDLPEGLLGQAKTAAVQ